MDEQKGCQFCYYEYFDGKAYPCSMCIRGEERTDKFEPKGRQTKQTDTHEKAVEALAYLIRQKKPSYSSGSNSYGEQIQTDKTDCPWK